jgi:hypothetical protein
MSELSGVRRETSRRAYQERKTVEEEPQHIVTELLYKTMLGGHRASEGAYKNNKL